jgi:murein DD-endopeptidase MepM/ murein hydrolase activator NlpD
MREPFVSEGVVMTATFRRLLVNAFAVCSIPGVALAADTPAPSGTAAPGTVVRWTSPGTTRCGMLGRTWAALQETCYYPVDILQKPGVIAVARIISGRREVAHITVGPFAYGTEEITLPDIPQAHPSPADVARNSRDQALQSRVWARPEGPATFTLPIGAPVKPLPEAASYGVKRIFDGKPDVQPHMGIDYAAPANSQVLSAAAGKVVIASELFFAGNAVFIDHGNGLVTMYFHLADIKVTVGQLVSAGEVVGVVGSTGRSTGPHLFFGVRWHDWRIDPKFLLGAPGATIPSLAVTSVSPAHDSAKPPRPPSQKR